MSIWDQPHTIFQNAEWVTKPSLFSQWVFQFFPPTGTILDIGGGQGKDTRFFVERGYTVTLTDYSDAGLDLAKKKTDPTQHQRITFIKHDTIQSFPFSDSSFDVVYSHFALHYFDDQTMRRILTEITRLLKPAGIFATLLNSVHNPEYGQGKVIGPDYFLFPDGRKKRFFSAESFQSLVSDFKTIVLDENGSALKKDGLTDNLIRFVGKKHG